MIKAYMCDKIKYLLDMQFITSQRGSVWHCHIGRLLTKGKMLFSTSPPGKQINILETSLAGVNTLVRSTSLPTLVQIGCEMAPPRGGEIWRFCDFFSRLFSFFRFLHQPTGRNFCPICRLRGSKDAFQLMHVPFQGLVPSNFVWANLRSKNRSKKCYIFHSKLQTRNSFFVMVVQPEVYFSRWQLPHLGFRKTVAIVLLFNWSLPKLVETLELPLGIYRWRR